MQTTELLLLSCVKGLGIGRLRKLHSLCSDFNQIKKWSAEEWDHYFGKYQLYQEFWKTFNNSEIHRRIENSILGATKVITFWDKKYPKSLESIDQPPLALFLKGNTECLEHKLIAIVGTRSISPYGKFVTYQLSKELAEHGYTLISGFARGVDTISHQAVVQANGHTIAVLGSGLDVVYPPENSTLYKDVLQHGLFISEFLAGTQPDAPNFPKRNRIIAALCSGLLVVEAGKKSGSLITAELALEYGKDIFAVPGQINSKQSEGTNHLIKDGAFLVQNVDDILFRLDHVNKKNTQLNMFDLSDNYTDILNELSSEPIHIDRLSVKLSRPVSELAVDLLQLEFDQLVTDVGGKSYVRTQL